MKIAVFGLGYVGTTLSLCLAQDGHEILGYDISREKIESLESGMLHLFEPGLNEIFEKNRKQLTLRTRPEAEFRQVDVVFICVGTPARPEGDVVLDQVEHVISELKAFKEVLKETSIVLRSTVPPGTTERILLKEFNERQVFYIPEFLREGNALKDYQASQCVVGVSKPRSFKKADVSKLECLPNFLKANFVHYNSAEFVKYMNNSFHALKICFVNEVGSLASSLNVNRDELFDLFLEDKYLNISEAYLQPGFSYGGSCLSKDLKGLNKMFLSCGVENKLTKSIELSNQDHNDRFLELIEKFDARSVCFLGMSFKKETDDLRFSGVLRLIERLLNRPSYSRLEKVGVLEKGITLSKLKSKLSNQIDYCKAIDKAVSEYELIVLGPYSLSEAEKNTLKEYSGKMINLGFVSQREISDWKASIYSVI